MANVVFESAQMADELCKVLISTTDECIKEFVQNVKASLNEGKDAVETEEVILNEVNHIIAHAKFYADAILDSYGVGSLADTGPNTYWDEYKNSPTFNRLRTGKEIVGRPRGSYIDPWGKQHSTWGNLAGQNLENRTFIDENGEEFTIKPKAPSRAIQSQEAWIIGKDYTWIERRLQTAAQTWLIQNSRRFFHN